MRQGDYDRIARLVEYFGDIQSMFEQGVCQDQHRFFEYIRINASKNYEERRDDVINSTMRQDDKNKQLTSIDKWSWAWAPKRARVGIAGIHNGGHVPRTGADASQHLVFLFEPKHNH